MKTRFLFALFLMCLFGHALRAQNFSSPQNTSLPQVQWSATLRPTDVRRGESAQIVVTAKIPKNWHLYSTTTPKGGPIATTLQIAPSKFIVASGAPLQSKPKTAFDKGFKLNVETFEGAATFVLPIQIAASVPSQFAIQITTRSMICSDTTCLPPRNETILLNLQLQNGKARVERLQPIVQIPPQIPPQSKTAISSTRSVPAASDSANDIAVQVRRAQNSGVGAFLLLSLVTGFAALLTPCVFPMIPLTVSVFAKKESDESKRDFRAPFAYCLGIVGTFTLIGLLVSAVFGASGITRLAANPFLNLAMATLFVVLALNLFGVFEIVVPHRVLDVVQTRGKNGLAAPLLMGLAFTLTSFTCTVPFVGTLLVATSKGSTWWPLLGMLAFSSSFASPFFLLALFPQWLSRLPKAGNWMVSFKATLGFLELAAALKFLSQADYVWNLGVLTRPIFLSLWSTLAFVAGFYLLRWLRLPHDASRGNGGFVRRGLGLAFCAVGVWLLAGMNRSSLGVLDAYAPPANYGSRLVNANAMQWLDNYDTAVARAISENKPLLINFTGYACTNCRVMESQVLPLPQVRREIENFVAVELYTDGTDDKSRRNSALQQAKFGTVALPLYVVVSPQGKELARLEGLHQNPQDFVDFLQRAQTKSSTRLTAR